MLSGINVKKIKFIVFTNMGMLSAFAGMIFAGRLNSATPRAGAGFELDAIAACYVGGASTSGGVGTILGCIVGALVMGTLNMGMIIMGMSVDWQNIVKGLVLIAAVCFDIFAKKRSTAAA
jgi:putative multiple sugar transport system permease protein